ncbi:hypothetical protein [Georgenia sp. SUBG003]|uniref:hypothetical protein n=1 Tax=Georgenia sp. SUBG003 TaxID=1497974 RepID=UPI003AB7EC70
MLRLSRRLRNESTLEVTEAQHSVLSALYHLGPMTARHAGRARPCAATLDDPDHRLARGARPLSLSTA